MSITIYHNPKCSKSRKTMEILVEKGIEPTVVEYLVAAPDEATIADIIKKSGLEPAAFVRSSDSAFSEAELSVPNPATAESVAALLADHPRFLQRPIVVSADGARVVIGRPPENVLELL